MISNLLLLLLVPVDCGLFELHSLGTTIQLVVLDRRPVTRDMDKLFTGDVNPREAKTNDHHRTPYLTGTITIRRDEDKHDRHRIAVLLLIGLKNERERCLKVNKSIEI
uniref:Putative secreted protein n=1 Tax=Anopheles marajoara TaxID=58244 RepID=A0A2M4C854_9DIPT